MTGGGGGAEAQAVPVAGVVPAAGGWPDSSEPQQRVCREPVCFHIFQDTTKHRCACGTGRRVLLRKEVIQPHLPVRLPCYDFVPIASPTFDGSLHKGWATGFGCCRLS